MRVNLFGLFDACHFLQQMANEIAFFFREFYGISISKILKASSTFFRSEYTLRKDLARILADTFEQIFPKAQTMMEDGTSEYSITILREKSYERSDVC